MDGEYIVPVQFEIKKQKNRVSNLYMTVALKKIEADVMGAGRKKGKFRAVPVISFNISISKFFENVKWQINFSL